MRGDLKISLIQTALQWEAPKENLLHFSSLVKNIKKGTTDIILLPEMFSTGFSMNAAAHAQQMNGDAVTWMIETSKNKNAVVCGSLIINEKNKYYNRLLWVQPDGKILHYDKRHLFRMANEHKTYTAGKKKLIVDYKGWKISPLICYDLRFPVWSRTAGDIDLVLFVANWPERRNFAWNHLLIARAIENQCYVAGLNRTGKDGENVIYAGNSMVLDPLGGNLITPSGKEQILHAVLSKRMLNDFRKSFPVNLDSDKFKII